MKYSDILGSSVGRDIDFSHASEGDIDRFCTAFEAQNPELFDRMFEDIVKKTGHTPTNGDVFEQILSRVNTNFFEPDDLNQVAYAAGFTGFVK